MLDPAVPQAHGSVRQAGPDDATVLAALCEEHAAYERLAYVALGHAAKLQQALVAGRLRAWLAEHDGQAVGYASVTVDFATLAALPYAHLDCLYLQAQARGRGLGQALMRSAMAFCEHQGCDTLQWQTPDWNHQAIAFYTGFGASAAPKQRFTLKLSSL